MGKPSIWTSFSGHQLHHTPVQLRVGLANLHKALTPSNEGHNCAENVSSLRPIDFQNSFANFSQKLERFAPRHAELCGIDDVCLALVPLHNEYLIQVDLLFGSLHDFFANHLEKLSSRPESLSGEKVAKNSRSLTNYQGTECFP